jgi:nucleotide sugar dehydrogenase
MGALASSRVQEAVLQLPESSPSPLSDPTLGDEEQGGLAERISTRTAVVGVVGLGYVGLPLLVAAGTQGFQVIGVDVDPHKVRSLAGRRSHIDGVSEGQLSSLGNVRYTTSTRPLRAADIIVITVPTPLTDAMPDLSLVKRACASVAQVLRLGQLVILESTTYPGTTDEIVLPILESSGLVAGRDFLLGYSPERINPGSSWNVSAIPKIVSGIDESSVRSVELFYKQIVPNVVRTPSPREAEMAKLIENTFRQVNIALVNELAMIAPDIGVDIWSALEAAATKPFGYMPFWPGPGVGGHCIAIDPGYLSWRVGQRVGFGLGFVEHATKVNKRMPAYVAARVGEALNDVGKPIRGSRILALGVSYKSGVRDTRESPAVAVIERLARAGAICSYHDPHVADIRMLGQELNSQPLVDKVVCSQDCVVILTSHPDHDYGAIVRSASLVFDARGATRGLKSPNIVRL